MAHPVTTSPAGGTATRCVTWPLDERRAEVRCWSASGQAIECCGHGLLGCAALWHRRWAGAGMLVSGTSEIATRIGDGLQWIGFPSLAAAALDPPSWLEPMLGAAVCGCSTAGGERGYLVAELAPGADLAAIAPPGQALGHHTQRALIVTALPAHPGQPADMEFRYFAPQYGQGEDAATGSAMRVLASHWQQRGRGSTLLAHQRSPAGGLLHSHVEGGTTWVGGTVSDE